ncbi:DNA circularization protein [Bordetella bronchialis]|uniref:DNA circulation N-terminal domain-containing protein n=1 Tax=Bordetella bronchialis TaxID=463025 RepID=A0A193FUA7_9BORD|nr:DNA circularization N-terminal domain-containing protein [Bordetella bronchialis]ANN70918.1 hypothetical protein BAU08_05850 [Bordetella bronchialis]
MSTSSDLLNVVGSIGGVANAVDNLFGPSAGSWEASLQQASFGGVPFGVNEARTRAGRRQAVHWYPYRDDAWAEDQGKLPRQFRVNGFLVENSLVYGGGGVIAQRERLLAVCEAAGTKTLVHPTFGTIKSVSCLECEVSERKDLGRVFEFTLVLLVTGERKYPGATQSTQDLLKAAAQKTRLQALLDFANTVKTVVQKGAAVVQQAVSTVLRYYQTAIGIVNGVRRVFNAVSTLSGNFGRLFGGGNSGYSGSNQHASASSTATDLLAANVAASGAVVAAGGALQLAAANISDTDAYGAAADTFVTAVAATAADPADGISMLAKLAAFQPAGTTTDSPIGQAMAAMNNACAAHLRRVAIASLAETVATYQPASQNDAIAVQTAVTAVIDAEILIAGDAGDDASYDALRELRQAVVADLQARGGDLAAMGSFSFNGSLPALAIANRIYRDPTRVDGLVRQVNPIHPAFMPPAFEALAS